MGVKAKAYASNAANFEDTANVVAEIHKDFGRIDILVNNAGITRDGLMMRMSEGQWDAVMKVREIAYLSDNLSYYIFCTINLLI